MILSSASMNPCVLYGRFWLRIGINAGAVATGFEQREAQCVFLGQKGAAGEPAAVTDDPITPPVTFDVEVTWWVDTYRDKIGHRDLQSLFHRPQQKALIS